MIGKINSLSSHGSSVESRVNKIPRETNKHIHPFQLRETKPNKLSCHPSKGKENRTTITRPSRREAVMGKLCLYSA